MTVYRIALAFALAVAAVSGVGCGDAPPATGGKDGEPGAVPGIGKHTVVIETSRGTITVELDGDKAPITVKNFLDYVDAKLYDGTIFHRVIDGFMIQGGGFDATTKKERETKDPIRNEGKNGLSNTRGTIAMARLNDPHSATAQFFINVVDNPKLNAGGFSPAGYAVFGRVTDGMDVVDQIKAVRTATAELGALVDEKAKKWKLVPMENVPVEPVEIRSIRRADAK